MVDTMDGEGEGVCVGGVGGGGFLSLILDSCHALLQNNLLHFLEFNFLPEWG